jgi:hypothetical protein
MTRFDTVWVVLLAMPTVAIASTTTVQHRQEILADHRPLVDDENWNERDARELSDFTRLASLLKDARQDRMPKRYREVNARIQEAITREIQQAQVKSEQAAQEARLSGRELRAERMEASVSGDSPDMFETRDDVRDHDNAMARYEEMVRVGTMATALQNQIERGDRAAMKRNLELTESFLGLLRRDLAATRAEAAEDRVELR